jgi:hypothetical protein
MPKVRYGSLESHPARFTDFEAWMLIGNRWREINASEIMFGGEEMSKEDFEETYGARPALPKHARSDPAPARTCRRLRQHYRALAGSLRHGSE